MIDKHLTIEKHRSIIIFMYLFLLFLLLLTGCTAITESELFNIKMSGETYVFHNPYEKVDWDNINHYKANFHAHTLYNKVEEDGTIIWPDGRILDPDGNQISDARSGWSYGDRDRSAFRNSTGELYGSDGRLYTDYVIDLYHQAGYKILSITDHDSRSYGSATTWTWNRWFRCSESLDMLAVEGNEISGPDHIGSFFNDYGDSSERSETRALKMIKGNDGLAIMFHPGRYFDDENSGSLKWYAEWYVDLFTIYTNNPLVGVEVFNQGDRYENDRVFWDMINTFVAPDMVIYGYSNDDMHGKWDLFRNYQFMLMQELTEEALRESMVNGAFYFSYEPDGSGEKSPPVPIIEKIEVSDKKTVIRIYANDSDDINWLSNLGVVGTDYQINLNDIEQDNIKFIRAELYNEYGTTFTQPFAINYR